MQSAVPTCLNFTTQNLKEIPEQHLQTYYIREDISTAYSYIQICEEILFVLFSKFLDQQQLKFIQNSVLHRSNLKEKLNSWQGQIIAFNLYLWSLMSLQSCQHLHHVIRELLHVNQGDIYNYIQNNRERLPQSGIFSIFFIRT